MAHHTIDNGSGNNKQLTYSPIRLCISILTSSSRKRNRQGCVCVWNQCLVLKLTKEVDFNQSKIYECLFYKGSVLYLIYTNDSILAGHNKEEVYEIIEQMKKVKLDIIGKGNIEDFLRVSRGQMRGQICQIESTTSDKTDIE